MLSQKKTGEVWSLARSHPRCVGGSSRRSHPLRRARPLTGRSPHHTAPTPAGQVCAGAVRPPRGGPGPGRRQRITATSRGRPTRGARLRCGAADPRGRARAARRGRERAPASRGPRGVARRQRAVAWRSVGSAPAPIVEAATAAGAGVGAGAGGDPSVGVGREGERHSPSLRATAITRGAYRVGSASWQPRPHRYDTSARGHVPHSA